MHQRIIIVGQIVVPEVNGQWHNALVGSWVHSHLFEVFDLMDDETTLFILARSGPAIPQGRDNHLEPLAERLCAIVMRAPHVSGDAGTVP